MVGKRNYKNYNKVNKAKTLRQEQKETEEKLKESLKHPVLMGLNNVMYLVSGGIGAYIFYKVYSWFGEVMSFKYGWLGLVLTIFAYFVGVGFWELLNKTWEFITTD